MLPNFLVIGAPRSGTTWLHMNLRLHPEIFIPRRKEIHFFDLEYDKGMLYYEEQFSEWSGQRIVGEATPDYLHGAYSRNDIPSLIKKHLPNAKLIAVLRNPTERVYSRYWNAKSKYENTQGVSFEEKLQRQPEFIAEGYYFDQLSRYYALFPREQILVQLYDDLLADPKSFMTNVYRFLGVDASFDAKLESVHINTAAGRGKLAKSQLFWLIARALYRFGAHDASLKIQKWNSIEIPGMDAEIQLKLIEIYREPNTKLAALLGRDLSAWNTTDGSTRLKGAR